jgi:hypothetical protein
VFTGLFKLAPNIALKRQRKIYMYVCLLGCDAVKSVNICCQFEKIAMHIYFVIL